MNQEQKMQAIVEAAGECWHDSEGNDPLYLCRKCEIKMGYHTCNPSPTDLNQLFRLAEKASDLGAITFTYEGDEETKQGTPIICWLGCNDEEYIARAFSPAEALFNALYKATTKEKEDEEKSSN